MKRLFTFFTLTALLGTFGFSQAEKKVFVEYFTQASCGPCANTINAFNQLMDNNASTVIQVRYHVSFPGFDPLNLDNPDDPLTRRGHYSLNAVPSYLVDADVTSGTPTQNDITQAANGTTPISVDVTHEFSNDFSQMNISVTVTNESTDVFDITDDALKVAIVEEEIRFPEPPGSTNMQNFRSVLKEFVTNIEGEAVGAIQPGDSLEFSYSSDLPERVYGFNELAVVAWVQRGTNGEVYNADQSESIEFPASNLTLSNYSLSSTGSGYCVEDIVGSVDLSYQGVDPVEGVYLNHSINGEPQGVFAGPYNLNPGDVESIDISSVALIAPSNLIEFYVGTETTTAATSTYFDQDVFDSGTPASTIASVVDDQGDLSYDFETEVLGDVLGYAAIDFQDIPLVWEILRGDATTPVGGFAESFSSVYVNFFQWNPAETSTNRSNFDILTRVTPNANTKLSFDHSFTTWSGSNDGLEIFVSRDCGVTFEQISSRFGADLRTAPELNANNQRFIPTSASDWESNEFDLGSFDGDEILIRFSAVSDWGDGLFIDNIETSSVVSVENTISAEEIEVYPNPVQDFVNFQYDGNIDLIEFVNSQGQVVRAVQNPSNTVNTSDLNNGIYIMKLHDTEASKTATMKIVKQ